MLTEHLAQVSCVLVEAVDTLAASADAQGKVSCVFLFVVAEGNAARSFNKFALDAVGDRRDMLVDYFEYGGSSQVSRHSLFSTPKPDWLQMSSLIVSSAVPGSLQSSSVV